MRKYYLFIIKKESFNAYQRKSYVLYKQLEQLYRLKKYDFFYGIRIYNKICLPFAVNILNNYIDKKIANEKVKNKIIRILSPIENTYLEINYSCVVIKTDVNLPNILKIFNIYNKNIFICDFENIDYFWLNEYLKTTYTN